MRYFDSLRSNFYLKWKTLPTFCPFSPRVIVIGYLSQMQLIICIFMSVFVVGRRNLAYVHGSPNNPSYSLLKVVCLDFLEGINLTRPVNIFSTSTFYLLNAKSISKRLFICFICLLGIEILVKNYPRTASTIGYLNVYILYSEFLASQRWRERITL